MGRNIHVFVKPERMSVRDRFARVTGSRQDSLGHFCVLSGWPRYALRTALWFAFHPKCRPRCYPKPPAQPTKRSHGGTYSPLESLLILFGVSRMEPFLCLIVSVDRQDSATEPAVEPFRMESISCVAAVERAR